MLIPTNWYGDLLDRHETVIKTEHKPSLASYRSKWLAEFFENPKILSVLQVVPLGILAFS